MDVRTCRRCRKLFNYVAGQPICPVCREELENLFQNVKKYLADNRNASINDVAEACEVDAQQIRQWVREERLQFSSEMAAGFGCERCGIGIRSGRFCDKCKIEMTKSFNDVIRKPAHESSSEISNTGKRESRMRFIDKR